MTAFDAIKDLVEALGPTPSDAVARMRWAGLVAWDVVVPERYPEHQVPESFRKLIREDSTWVAYASKGQIEKYPDMLKHFTDLDPSVASADVEGGGRIFFGAGK